MMVMRTATGEEKAARIEFMLDVGKEKGATGLGMMLTGKITFLRRNDYERETR